MIKTSTLTKQLKACSERLPESLHQDCLSVGITLVPELIALIEADLTAELPSDDWASTHAVTLLGEIGDERAAPVLIRCLAECDGLTFIHEEATKALQAFGGSILEICLEHYVNSDSDLLRDDLAIVLSRLPVKDERILELLGETLARSPMVGANCLFEYGDLRALPLLSQAFDDQPIESRDFLLGQTLIELRAAIIDLGGELTPAQIDKYELAIQNREHWIDKIFGGFMPANPKRQSTPIVRDRPKLGRNEPCWCGSGKKYKRCHGPLEH